MRRGSALLGKLGVRTLAVCQTFKDLITLLGYRPDVIVAAGPADLADRIRARELATYPAVIFTQAQPEGRLNCLHASLSPESLDRRFGICGWVSSARRMAQGKRPWICSRNWAWRRA